MMEGDIIWRTIIFCMSMTIVSGQYSLNVRLLSYQNPLHAAAVHQGDCCDRSSTDDPPNCTKACDNEFQFSLVIGGTGTIVGQFSTEVVDPSNDDLVFSPGEGSMLGGVPNPVVFEGLNTSILEYLELNMAVFDDDSLTERSEFIDSITISFENISLSTVSFTAPSIYSGEYEIAEATLSFGLECSENYFGENCTMLCIDADSDEIGHYVCDDMGNRVCREGYTNPSNGCVAPASTMRCSNEDETMKYIIITAIMAAISILMIPTTAVVTVALMKLRQRKLKCKSSGGMEMEGNPSYATAQTDHSAMHNDVESSTHHCNTTGGMGYFTNRQDDDLSYCQAYAVSTLSLGTLETSVELEAARVFSEESAYYSKARSISPCSDNTTEDVLGGEGIHVSQSEQDGYEDVWELDEGNYASLKRVGTNVHDNDTPELHYENP